jgi:hypothetical protein
VTVAHGASSSSPTTTSRPSRTRASGPLAAADLTERKARLYAEHVAHAVHADVVGGRHQAGRPLHQRLALSTDVSDPARRAKLRAKYRPVMQLFRELARRRAARGHPLFAARESLRAQLAEVWARDYSA